MKTRIAEGAVTGTGETREIIGVVQGTIAGEAPTAAEEIKAATETADL